MGRWAKEMIERGYVVLLIDSQGARGVDTNCFEPKGAIYHVRGALDVLQAAEHLRMFDFVDKKRIAAVGFSWGAMADLLAASALYQSAFKIEDGFAEFVAIYPACFTFVTPQGMPYEIVLRDIDKPGLVLMGGDDLEAPASQCVAKLQAAEWTGAPVQWHVFPNATHCWDCAHLDGYSKTDFRGNRVSYRFDGDVTAETKRRMFEFLDRVWEKQK
jgi:dienelactone hydrolase